MIAGAVAKHGNHDQKDHGNWARGHRRGKKQGIGVSSKMDLGGVTPEQKHAKAWNKREGYTPDPVGARVAAEYRRQHGLPEPDFGPGGLRSVAADLGRARQVASMALMEQARRIRDGEPIPAEVQRAYDDLVVQTKRQLAALEATGVKVEYLTAADIKSRGLDPEGLNPYATAEDQRNDIVSNKRLMIASLVDYPESYHPILDSSQGGAYDQFRAVHDYFGHAAVGTGFDRHGEFQAWLHHTSMFSGEARKAASSELHIENSFLASTGQSSPHFSYLLPDEWVEPFQADGTFKGPNWVKRGDVPGDVDG